MATSQQTSQQIRSQLKVLIPDLSMDPETPERKIVDTVSDVIAGASMDQYLLNYQFDIDTKVGSDLDKFIALFGFARQGGVSATGTVNFNVNLPSTQDIVIPSGTTVIQPATSISGIITFFTTVIAVLPAGGLSVTVPIQCSVPGVLGNVPAGGITQFGASQVGTISTVINAIATSNGSDPETDAELKVRFKNTIFRNVSGTEDQFLALAISTKFCNKAIVLGPLSRYIEYVQVPPSLTLVSTITYSKYTYNFDYYLTDGNFGNENFYIPNGVDYTFTNSVPPTLTVANTVNLPVNDVVLLEHTYCSVNSRNDPSNNVANYVDVFVDGHDEQSVTETVIFPSSSAAFVNTTSAYDIYNFQRLNGTHPVVGNILQEFVWQPVFSIPGVITINGIDYFENTHYWQVKDTSLYKSSRRSRDGIEWSAAVTVAANTAFTMSYVFDKLPLELNELMDTYKQITSDVLVHSANQRYFNLNFIVMYSPGFNVSSVNGALSTSLSNFFSSLQFGAVIQISDILEIAHEVAGVNNIRLATPSDGTAYGIQEIAQDGITILGAPYVSDFFLSDSDLPVLNAIFTTQKSQNTWTN